MDSVYDKISEIRNSKTKAILCIIVAVKGSAPRHVGSKMIVTADRKLFGTIGGGALENAVIERRMELINHEEPQILKYNLSKDLGMTCGGEVQIYAEPILNKNKVFIFGAGHVGKSLAGLLSKIDFDIHVIDDRPEIFDDWQTGSSTKHCLAYSEFFENNKSDCDTFVVIVTKGHASDKEILKNYIKQDFAYIGLIGSKRKIQELRNNFLENDFASEEELNQIYMPIGLDILAEGPDEISISIAAQLILEKNKRIINRKDK